MGTFQLYANATGLVDESRQFIPISSEAEATESRYPVFIAFAAAQQNKFKKITKISVNVYANPEDTFRMLFSCVDKGWNTGSLTWKNRPGTLTVWNGKAVYECAPPQADSDGYKVGELPDWVSYTFGGNPTPTNSPIRDVLKRGVKIERLKGSGSVETSLSETHKPFLEVEYADETVGITLSSASPRSGYIPKNRNCTFRWRYEPDGVCAGDIQAETVKFRWRAKGADGYTEINCGSASSYTLQGASITADAIEWQLEATDSAGAVTTTAWLELSTVEALSSAVAESPKDIMVDGSSPAEFCWTHLISTGTAPTASELQCSTDGSTWTALATVSGSETVTTIQAGTLPAGDVLWRVRTYNTDNAAGAWSDAASVLVVAAPPAPTVSAEQTPRPLISWQSQGQQGYQIRIPGAWESGSVYGTYTSRKLPVILPDGVYTAEVRVVNEYGLWSDWGSAPLTVSNSPGAAITLAASADGEISLSWSSSGSYQRYLVERDGVPLAVTQATVYTDLTAVGEHSYRVLGIQAGGDDYGVSNTVTVTLTVDVNSITDLETGERLDLPYSTMQIQDERIRLERTVAVTHFTGADWPSAEISRYRDKSAYFEAAFRDLAQAARLEALLGRLVCLKAKNGESCTGIISALQKTSSAFWVDYTATVIRLETGEEAAL